MFESTIVTVSTYFLSVFIANTHTLSLIQHEQYAFITSLHILFGIESQGGRNGKEVKYFE